MSQPETRTTDLRARGWELCPACQCFLPKQHQVTKWCDGGAPQFGVAIDAEKLRRLDWMVEALSRAECRRQGIAPDEIIADGGHMAWQLVGYEAAKKEMPNAES